MTQRRKPDSLVPVRVVILLAWTLLLILAWAGGLFDDQAQHLLPIGGSR